MQTGWLLHGRLGLRGIVSGVRPPNGKQNQTATSTRPAGRDLAHSQRRSDDRRDHAQMTAAGGCRSYNGGLSAAAQVNRAPGNDEQFARSATHLSGRGWIRSSSTVLKSVERPQRRADFPARDDVVRQQFGTPCDAQTRSRSELDLHWSTGTVSSRTSVATYSVTLGTRATCAQGVKEKYRLRAKQHEQRRRIRDSPRLEFGTSRPFAQVTRATPARRSAAEWTRGTRADGGYRSADDRGRNTT